MICEIEFLDTIENVFFCIIRNIPFIPIGLAGRFDMVKDERHLFIGESWKELAVNGLEIESSLHASYVETIFPDF